MWFSQRIPRLTSREANRLDARAETEEMHTGLRAEQHHPFTAAWGARSRAAVQEHSDKPGAQHSQAFCGCPRSLRLEILINSQRSQQTNNVTVMCISWQIPRITFFTTAERTEEWISRVFIGCIHAFFS